MNIGECMERGETGAGGGPIVSETARDDEEV